MIRSCIKRCVASALIVAGTLPLGAAAFNECDGVPVRPAHEPIVLRPNGCTISDLTGDVGRSALILAREGSSYWTTHVLPPNATDPCVITHEDGTWDVALVAPGVIDGRAGRTIEVYEQCPDSKMLEADIMISATLDFSQADQRRFLTSGAAGLGRHGMLHEYGHALGLEHDDDEFGVMRSSVAIGAPMGGHTDTGSPHYFFADDAYGLLQIRGLPTSHPNFYVSAQVLLPNGMLRNADVNPATGAPHANPLSVRTRELIVFSAGAGTHYWWGRNVLLRAYADSSTECTPLPDVGVTLGYAAVPLNKFATARGDMTVKIPPLGPSGQVLNVHVAGTLIPAQFSATETRGWDDCATTGLRLKTP